MKHIKTFENFLNESMSPAVKALDDSYTKYAKSINNSKTESITAYGWLKEIPRSTKLSDLEEVLNIYFKNHQPIIKSVIDTAKSDGFMNEGYMSELDIIRQQSKTVDEFVKNAKREFKEIAKMKDADEFLKELWQIAEDMNESRSLTREDNIYIRGIEFMEKKYANDPITSKAMKDVRDNVLPSGKTYKDLTPEQLMYFNIAISRCVPGRPENKNMTDISAMVAAFPNWPKD
jgi:hypothetical protein